MSHRHVPQIMPQKWVTGKCQGHLTETVTEKCHRQVLPKRATEVSQRKCHRQVAHRESHKVSHKKGYRKSHRKVEVFTLSHVFQVESRWSPGTLPGFCLDSRYFPGGLLWQWTPAKLGLECTWSAPGIPAIFPGLFLEFQGLQAPGLCRDSLESRYTPSCDMLLEQNYWYIWSICCLWLCLWPISNSDIFSVYYPYFFSIFWEVSLLATTASEN